MKRLWVVTAIGWAIGCTAGFDEAQAESAAETAKEKPYALSVSATPQALAVGAEATYVLTVAPSAPWHLKPETPFKAVLESSEGIVLAKIKLTAQDFADSKSDAKSVKTPFKAKAKGAQSIKANLTFFLCTDEICQRYKDTAALAVQVK